jgi:hypothetical protein
MLSFPSIYNHKIKFSTLAELTKQKKYLSTKLGTSLKLSCSEQHLTSASTEAAPYF